MFDELAFPRTAKYNERWIRENALGENALCQAESLARHLPFSSGMRIRFPAQYGGPRTVEST
jgi:hypothetical protein